MKTTPRAKERRKLKRVLIVFESLVLVLDVCAFLIPAFSRLTSSALPLMVGYPSVIPMESETGEIQQEVAELFLGNRLL